MALHQSVARHGFIRQAAQARALNKQRRIAPHVLDATVEYAEETREIVYRLCITPYQVGQVVLLPDQNFYIVASRFAGRYYVVAHQNGQLTCSSRDERTAQMCIEKVKAHRAALATKKAAA